MFKTMLPGPLATLHFTKIDLGPVPLRLSNAKTTKTEVDGIKLDLNVDWVGKADIEMDANMIPALVSLCLTWENRISLTLATGCRKCTASWQTFCTAVSIDKCDTTGTSIFRRQQLFIDTYCRLVQHKYHS